MPPNARIVDADRPCTRQQAVRSPRIRAAGSYGRGMRYLPALIVDAVFVLIFAVIGRASHQEDPAGFLLTAWPFLVALVVGHALAALMGSGPRKPWSLLWGVTVWVVTVAGGMLLRIVAGDTAQLAFIIVATIVLGVFLVGWRALASVLRRRQSAKETDAAASDPVDDPAAEQDPSAD